MSGHAIDHMVLQTDFVDSMKHQVRWMKSTRFSRPKGHFGTALTFSMPYALLSAAIALAWHRPVAALLLLLWGWSTRILLGAVVGGLVVQESHLARTLFLYPFRDFLGFCYWVASYLSSQVRWRGEVYNLLQDGLMKSEGTEREPEAILIS